MDHTFRLFLDSEGLTRTYGNNAHNQKTAVCTEEKIGA